MSGEGNGNGEQLKAALDAVFSSENYDGRLAKPLRKDIRKGIDAATIKPDFVNVGSSQPHLSYHSWVGPRVVGTGSEDLSGSKLQSVFCSFKLPEMIVGPYKKLVNMMKMMLGSVVKEGNGLSEINTQIGKAISDGKFSKKLQTEFEQSGQKGGEGQGPSGDNGDDDSWASNVDFVLKNVQTYIEASFHYGFNFSQFVEKCGTGFTGDGPGEQQNKEQETDGGPNGGAKEFSFVTALLEKFKVAFKISLDQNMLTWWEVMMGGVMAQNGAGSQGQNQGGDLRMRMMMEQASMMLNALKIYQKMDLDFAFLSTKLLPVALRQTLFKEVNQLPAMWAQMTHGRNKAITESDMNTWTKMMDFIDGGAGGKIYLVAPGWFSQLEIDIRAKGFSEFLRPIIQRHQDKFGEKV